MARILIATFGSYGDLFPYLSIGQELQRRGHEVTIATSASYRDNVQAAGLSLHAVRPDVSLDDRQMLSYVFDRRRGTERIVRYVAGLVRDTYQDTVAAVTEWADLVVTHPLTYAAALAVRNARKLWVSSVLAPISFISAFDPPVPANAPWLIHIRRLFGPRAMRATWDLGRRVGNRWAKPVIEFGRELGLDMRQSPLFEGGFSSDCILALFSRLMGEPQQDWPRRTVVTGFPFFDRSESLPRSLQEFLDSGPAPIVFTLGSSAVGAAGSFYRESLHAAGKLGMRSVLLTGTHRQNLPAKLPATAIAVEYAPHKLVFARAAVTVHQGGIGTTAEALRSGRPMLVVPFAHDQFDNARRMEVLGVARQLWQSNYASQSAARLLADLLGKAEYASVANKAAQIVRSESGSAHAADAIEGVLNSGRYTANVI
jgi:UDP:flavonoid glycosyltransferase YjiC (YdhE family)